MHRNSLPILLQRLLLVIFSSCIGKFRKDSCNMSPGNAGLCGNKSTCHRDISVRQRTTIIGACKIDGRDRLQTIHGSLVDRDTSLSEPS